MAVSLLALPRRFPSRLPVRQIGFAPEKTGWMDTVFKIYAFSFIRRGSGEYRVGGRTWPVHAPCVLTQRPDEHFTYGPHGTWDEIWFTYDVAVGPELRRCSLISDERPIWYIGDPGPVQGQLDELERLLAMVDAPGIPDRIDRLCEAMVVASLVHNRPQVQGEAARAVAEIRALVEERCLDQHDFVALAARRGLSPGIFRRQWDRMVGVPPQRYLACLRMRRACRMLAETDEPVAEIARRLGFDDPLHFSRRFRAIIGETATAHRRNLGGRQR